MDRRVTSPTWGPPPPCKQALNKENGKTKRNYDTMHACNTYTCKIFVFLNWFQIKRGFRLRSPCHLEICQCF